MRPRAAVLAVPLLLAPGVLALFAGGYFDTARLRAGIAAWALLAAVAVLAPEPLPRSGPARAALAGLAALTALTGLSLLWTPVAGPAVDDLQRLGLYLPAFAAALALLRDPAAARLTAPLLLAGIAAATAWGLGERLLPTLVEHERVLSAGDRLAYPLSYWNAAGAFAALGLLLAVGLAADGDRSRRLRAAAAATGPLLGLALYLTFSRGALAALVAGLGVLLALAPTRAHLRAAAVLAGSALAAAVASLALPPVATVGGGGDAAAGAAMLAILAALCAAAGRLGARAALPSLPTPRVRAAALALLAVAVAGSVVAVAATERRGGRDESEATAGRLASAQSNRYAYWRVAMRTFAEHPALGAGAGSFRAEWLRERPFRESVRDAHSLYLETAAELGLAGLAALALLLGGIAAGAARALRRAGPPAAPAAAAVAAWAVHAGLDWDWEMPALTLVALLLAAWLLVSPRATRGRAAG